MVKLIVLVLIVAASHSICHAQDAAILHRVADRQESLSNASTPRAAHFFRPDDTSELRLLLSGVVRGYQLLISSQDTDVCAYEPSCSRFGMLSMQRFGIIKGFLLTSDRLTRCNGLTDGQHERNSSTGKLIDPVSAYDSYMHDHR